MDLKQAKCPSCGAGLQIPLDREKWHCGYCGSDFLVSDGISAAVSENKEALKQLARAAEEAKNWTEANKLWTKVLARDANDAEAWFQKGISELRSVEGTKLYSIIGDILNKWAAFKQASVKR